ncbi:MAG: N-acetyl-gamma-glutamyl-phosphate reductase [Bacteroidetes bacterium]|nr:N-acetyl-gamma-glutamyl-phosphate reductase [Bacteroidota bacterium]
MNPPYPILRAAILHGAGYGGGELVRLLLAHPGVELAAVTSRTFAGQHVSVAHPTLLGQTDLHFSDDEIDVTRFDVVFIAAEHGQSAKAVQRLDAAGYAGTIVDLSADFRFQDATIYPQKFKFNHPIPERLPDFHYGLAEVTPPPVGTRCIANPGCFASGIALALWPLAQHLPDGFDAYVTALTGASGSGARPSATTHFPTRDGNVRAYKILDHQHQPEIEAALGHRTHLQFVPASGPWTRGIWGTAHVPLPDGVSLDTVRGWYAAAYPAGTGAVRLWETLPELRASVGTPFCDLGLAEKDGHLVVGFGLDNLLKGAASQAVQNLNLTQGWPSLRGLVVGGG